MEQKIQPLSADDSARLEKQRAWVRDHYDPGARHQYDSLDGKLRLLETILQENWIDATETWKLQSLGITFGDALAEKMRLVWVAVEDERGRDPALRDCSRTLVLFPMTMISKRVERGETVAVRDLFAGMCEKITCPIAHPPERRPASISKLILPAGANVMGTSGCKMALAQPMLNLALFDILNAQHSTAAATDRRRKRQGIHEPPSRP